MRYVIVINKADLRSRSVRPLKPGIACIAVSAKNGRRGR